MRAVEIRSGFGLENLVLVDRAEPTVGPGQVKVRVRATSLNYRDYRTVQGTYNPRMALPKVPLSDGAGDVVEVGPEVKSVRVGDRVAATFFQQWSDGPLPEGVNASALGGDLNGMLAEFVVLDEAGVIPFPTHLSHEEAACLPCAALTAWCALFEYRAIRPGQTVLVQGTGGVSVFATQFAKMAGARVVMVSGSDDKIARAKTLGVDHSINYRTTAKWGTEVRKWAESGTGAGGSVGGVDHVIEVGGTGTLGESLKAIRAGGVISMIGVLDGIAGEVAIGPILHKAVTIQGIFVGSRAMFTRMNAAISQHQLRPVVGMTYPMEQIRTALELMAGGGHFGKIVVRV